MPPLPGGLTGHYKALRPDTHVLPWGQVGPTADRTKTNPSGILCNFTNIESMFEISFFSAINMCLLILAHAVSTVCKVKLNVVEPIIICSFRIFACGCSFV